MIKFVPRVETNDEFDLLVDAVSSQSGYSQVLCRMLCLRGIKTAQQACEFLFPSDKQLLDPFELPDMDKAVARINLAIANNERICIFGDYDADGMCATSILLMYLRYVGACVTYYIPSRHDEGYGMTAESVKKLAADDVKLIITVDNGITALKEIEQACDLGLDVIVTDHHKCTEDLPMCIAVVCHTRPDNKYKNTNLCGAGIALKLVEALGGLEAASAFLPFAGLATVADAVSLTGENRAIVSLALQTINSINCPIGFHALAQVVGMNQRRITERDIGFAFAPRLNASGRLAHASLGVELLCATDMEYALDIAQQLNELNTLRRTEETQILDNAVAMVEALPLSNLRIIALFSDSWHDGVIGIAASRICELYNRPTVLFHESDGMLCGSARSIAGIDIHKALSQYKHLYTKFGGHPYAAGLTMPKENFSEFVRGVNQYLYDSSDFTDYIPTRVYDMKVDFDTISMDVVGMFERLAPFGEGNPAPTFLTEEVSILQMRKIGAEAAHINGKMHKGSQTIDFVAFNKAARFNELNNSKSCDVVYNPTINTWGNSTNVQIQVAQFKAHYIQDYDSFVRDLQERFSIAFYKNLIYNKKKLQDRNVCVDCNETRECIKRRFKSSSEGTIVLCFTESGAKELLGCLHNSPNVYWDVAVGVPIVASCLFNTVVLAPIIEDFPPAACRYSTIIIYDAVVSLGIVAKLHEMNPLAQIVLSTESVYTFEKQQEELEILLKRDNCLTLYRQMTNMVNVGGMDKERLLTQIARNEFESVGYRILLNVFLDLELLNMTSGGFVTGPTKRVVKRELNESDTYSNVARTNQCIDETASFLIELKTRG